MIDFTYFGQAVGVVMVSWLIGMIAGVVLGVLRKGRDV